MHATKYILQVVNYTKIEFYCASDVSQNAIFQKR